MRSLSSSVLSTSTRNTTHEESGIMSTCLLPDDRRRNALSRGAMQRRPLIVQARRAAAVLTSRHRAERHGRAGPVVRHAIGVHNGTDTAARRA